jgi:hypothetical protein
MRRRTRRRRDRQRRRPHLTLPKAIASPSAAPIDAVQARLPASWRYPADREGVEMTIRDTRLVDGRCGPPRRAVPPCRVGDNRRVTAEPLDVAGVGASAVALDDAWLRSYAAGLGAAVRHGEPGVRVGTPSGAIVIQLGDAVVKLHHPRTDPAALSARLTAIVELAARNLFVQPLSAAAVDEPVTGRLVTAWPLVEVLDAQDEEVPWAAAGALLARLHRAPVVAASGALADHGGAERLARAVARVVSIPTGDQERALLSELGARLVEELGEELSEVRHQGDPRSVSLVHGDWHLGQLARAEGRWLLLDVDDLGLGDPSWDLGRPAGFWAAGLLSDEDWGAFLSAYRASDGPGVPPVADPWPRLDLAARSAVYVATVRALHVQPTPSEISASGLLQACMRM